MQAETFPWMISVTGKDFDGKPLFDKGFLSSLLLEQFVRDSYSTAIAETPSLAGDTVVDRGMRKMSYVIPHALRAEPPEPDGPHVLGAHVGRARTVH